MTKVLDLGRTVSPIRVPLLIAVIAFIDVAFGFVHLVVIDVAAGFVQLGDRTLGMPLGSQVTRLIDLGAERNIPTWYSSIKLFVLGAMLFVIATVSLQRGVPRSWIMLALAVAFVAMSLDEFAGIHERIGRASDRLLPGGDRANTAFARTGVWMFLLAVPVLIVLLWMVSATRKLWDNRRATRIFVIGVVVLMGSAGGIEILKNVTTGRARLLQEVAEECGEMLGVTIMLWAVYELLRSHGIRVFSVQPQEKK